MATILKNTDQAAMNAWGEMSGDLNPLHCDPEFAAQSRYGGTILHGHMTIAWLIEWAKSHLGRDWVEHGAIRGLRFRRPLRPGVTYRIGPHPDFDATSDFELAIREPDDTVAVTCTISIGEGK